MSNAVDVYLASDAADVVRVGQFAQQGDLIVNKATAQVNIMLPGGPTPLAATVAKIANVAALTSGAGTPAAGTVDVGAAFSQATLNNNFATLVTEINAIRTAMVNGNLMTGP